MDMYTNYGPGQKDLEAKAETPRRPVSKGRKGVEAKSEETEFHGAYHSGPQIVYQPFANLKLR